MVEFYGGQKKIGPSAKTGAGAIHCPKTAGGTVDAGRSAPAS